ncbi:MAG: acetyltransferase [Deltaproteobacteria bacterium]|nr:acetyltransferase [Deltaproteobacteria bacterium]
MSRALLVVGAGGHARPLIDAALEAGFTISGVVDLSYHGQSEQILGQAVIGGVELLEGDSEPREAALAIGDNALRRQWFQRLVAAGWPLPKIVHPRAVVSRHAELGQAVFINGGAVINAGARIGDDVIVNTGAVVDHETIVGAHSHVGPGAQLAGRVTIGEQTFVGIGATVIDRIQVGDEVMIGAGAAVIRDVPSGVTVVGVPGRTRC